MNNLTNAINMDIGKNIKKIRLLRKVTQAELGQELGVTFQQIQKYERGQTPISAASLYMASAYLDAPITFFFGITKKYDFNVDLASFKMLHKIQQLSVDDITKLDKLLTLISNYPVK